MINHAKIYTKELHITIMILQSGCARYATNMNMENRLKILLVKLHYFVYLNHYRIPYFIQDMFPAFSNLDFPSETLLEYCINNNLQKPKQNYLLDVAATFINFKIIQGTEVAIERCLFAFPDRMQTRERLRQLLAKFIRDNYETN